MNDIEKIFTNRGNSVQVAKCLDDTSKKLNLPIEVIEKNILEYVKERNYVGVVPGAWSDKNARGTTSKNFLQNWENDVNGLNVLNKIVEGKNKLRVCSFNVHYWLSPDNKIFNLQNMLRDISAIDADVLCLQEAVLPLDMKEGTAITSKDQWNYDDIIREFIDLGYKDALHCATDNQAHAGENSFFGNAIFSKYPIIKKYSQNIKKYIQSRCFLACKIDIPKEGIVTVVNTHLDVFDDSENVRYQEIKELMSEVQNGEFKSDNVIICGDFNSLRRNDYNDKEWKWLSNNNQGHPLHTKVTDFMEESGFDEVFGDNFLKYSVWTARRVDYIWYNLSNFAVDRGNVYYTSDSDHFPIIADFEAIKEKTPKGKTPKEKTPKEKTPKEKTPKGKTPKEGEFKCLMWTHNTPYETLYNMMLGKFERMFRGASNGEIIGRGAQFRYGVDSQYGDVVFVMKKGDWWKKMRGPVEAVVSDPHIVMKPSKKYVKAPLLGHIFGSGEYEGLYNYTGKFIKKLDNLMVKNAEMFRARPKNASGSGIECGEKSWIMTWCNLQMHIADNVSFDNVEKVFVPRWMSEGLNLRNMSRVASISDQNEFFKMVNNKLPKFRDGRENALNGKFEFYGPEKTKDAYQFLKEDAERWYAIISPKNYKEFGSTYRYPMYLGNSSKLAISAEAFADLEIKYAELLRKNNCKK